MSGERPSSKNSSEIWSPPFKGEKKFNAYDISKLAKFAAKQEQQ